MNAVEDAVETSRLEMIPRHRRELLEHCRREVRQIERFCLLEAHLAAGRSDGGQAADEARKMLRLATGLRRGLDKWR